MSAFRSRAVFSAVCLACAAVLAGCLIPGINDGSGEARTQPDFGSVAARRIAPTQPDNVNEAVVDLTWTKVAGATGYNVFFGTDTTPPLLVTVTNERYAVRYLSLCTTYYWRVVAVDDTEQTVSSPTWSFTTRCP